MLRSLMETIKQKGVRRTDDNVKTPKTRKKRRRHRKHRKDKGSEDSVGKAPLGATRPVQVQYELSELPLGCRRYFPPEVWRARAEMSSGLEGRSSSSSRSSLENEQPKMKQATLSTTACSCVDKEPARRCTCCMCSSRQTEASNQLSSRRYIQLTERTVKEPCNTVRWKLTGDDKAVEQYKAERRQRYEEDFKERKLSLTMKKAEQQTLATVSKQ